MSSDTRFWDDIAESYSRRPLPNPDSTRRKLEIVRSHMKPQDTVLDIGCGTGTIALELAPHADRVLGLDVSGEMVKIARQKARTQGVSNVEFHQGSVDDGLKSFAASSFEGICAFNILHLVENWHGAVVRIFDLLKPGGYFVSSSPCLGDSWVPYRPILAVMRWVGKAPKVEFLAEDTLLHTMRTTGFVDVEQPDVGADKGTAFVVARRPGA